jgi:preprotein translocase subunit SecY
MTSELARRIAITIGALLIFRLGSHIPLAGISPQIQAGLLPSGAIARISIFSLSLIPYLSAAILIQLVAVVWGRLSALERSGEAGRRRIARYTLILTLLLAAFQAFGIASALQNISGLVIEPGGWFLLSATATLAGGVFFLVWLSEQITRHGIGNGLALILFVGIIVSLPADIAATFELLRQGTISGSLLLLMAVLSVALVAVIVLIEGARRNVPVQYAARQAGTRLLPPRSSSVLSIKLNSAGFLIPATVTPWIFYLPLALATFLFGQTPWLAAAYEHIQFARPAHMILGSIAVFALAFIYTAYVLDPERAAETLRERGGAIPDVAPGEPTADYLDRVVTLTTVIGAVYLVAVSLLPEVLVAYGELPYLFGGGSALIVVCTILDIETQVRGYSLTKPGGE